jgi:hypothetical protein
MGLSPESIEGNFTGTLLSYQIPCPLSRAKAAAGRQKGEKSCLWRKISEFSEQLVV